MFFLAEAIPILFILPHRHTLRSSKNQDFKMLEVVRVHEQTTDVNPFPLELGEGARLDLGTISDARKG